ncbi:MAG: hypothetical protein AAGA56_09740 [Myxococcota bacterium]
MKRWFVPLLLIAGCADIKPPSGPEDRWVQAEAAPADSAPPPGGAREVVAKMLERVSRVRGLAVKEAVRAKVVSRAEAIAHIQASTERDIPRRVLEGQGEFLRGLGLIRLDYDYVDGVFALLQGNIAGFYDQRVKTMFLLSDLRGSSQAETLAHELVHALQDQHFDLDLLLDYEPGQADRITAAHALCEGGAMAAMFEVGMGRGGDARIGVGQLRMAMLSSVALTEGARTPRVLQVSLVAPYIDGFRFVRALKARGGWPAVDAAYARLPRTTEQLLHLDKYDADEPALPVDEPPLPPGSDWRRLDVDTLGEQALGIVFSEWSSKSLGAAAAAGWGGDRFTIAKRGSSQYASAVSLRFDSNEDAAEAEAVLARVTDGGCRAREALGPLAYRRDGTSIAVVAGAFERDGGTGRAVADCGWADRWLEAVLRP